MFLVFGVKVVLKRIYVLDGVFGILDYSTALNMDFIAVLIISYVKLPPTPYNML